MQFYEDAEQPKSPNESWAVDQGRVMRSLQIRNTLGLTETDRFNAAKALVGYPQLMVSNTLGSTQPTNYISRQLPDFYPAVGTIAVPQIPYLWATSISRSIPLGAPITPGVDGLGCAIYGGHRFDVNYSLTTYSIRSDDSMNAGFGRLIGLPDEGFWLQSFGWLNTRFVTRTYKQSSKVYTLPTGFVNIATDPPLAIPQTVSQGLPFRTQEGTIRYTWHQVPYNAIPYNAQANCITGVNNVKFDGFETGTLYLADIEENLYTNAFGIRLADITYVMLYRRNVRVIGGTPIGALGWNGVLLYNKAAKQFLYTLCTADGSTSLTDGNVLYPYRDFQTLFRPDQP